MDEVGSGSSGSDTESESEGEVSPGTPSEDEPRRGEEDVGDDASKKRKNRKRKSLSHHRRKLRSKYESIEDFNPEARTAQTEELERIRRLELQQSLTAEEEGDKDEGPVASLQLQGERPLTGGDGESAELMVVDLTEGLKDDGKARSEAIVIDSGSESEEERQLPQAKRPKETTGSEGPSTVAKHVTSRAVSQAVGRGKYDVICPMPDGRVLINTGHPAEEPDICLAPQIMAAAKPHQVGGIRFLYDNIVESLTRFASTPGFGCILAHSMGLGKTLQLIGFIDLFLRHTPSKYVLCVVPVNTLQNWVSEFDQWLPAPPGSQAAASGNGKKGSKGGLVTNTGILPSLLLSNPGGRDSPMMNARQELDTGLGMGLNTSPVTAASLNTGEASSLYQPEGVQYRTFRLFCLSEVYRTMESRLRIISEWQREGGVMLIGYDMYRLLSLSVPSLGGNKMAVKRKSKAKKAPQLIDLDENEKEMDALIGIQQALCNPGPDLVVCDEGHRIKNDYTNISQALKKIRTRRRVVMTGYPLQNNLTEYWCMVDFVRPKYLGTKQEFNDLFERPITNGQCVDSTPADVRVMRYRSHVLHTLLKGFVLRRGHEILQHNLPPKFEHVLFLRPSQSQAVLYDYNMRQMLQGGQGVYSAGGPLRAFAVCSKIWNHPDIYNAEAMAQERSSPTSWLDEAGLPRSLAPKNSDSSSSLKIEWPPSLSTYQQGHLSNSPKMVVLLELIDRSVQVGDRVLVFSQSLSTLSYIEKLLSQRPIPVPHSMAVTDMISQERAGAVQYSAVRWTKNKNYCRLDGSTGSMERDRLITSFNSTENSDCWVFLLSTKAGCLGVNLVGANRVIVLDVSWNPCYDAQAVCRVYRYGQTKPSYIYRMVCDGTMEKKIYDRQISKQGMADRVIDELHPERHFTNEDIVSLMTTMTPLPEPRDCSSFAQDYLFDPLLMHLCRQYGPLLTKLPFKHESLLLDSVDERMTDVEKYIAMKGFQQDWQALKSAPANATQAYRAQQQQQQQQQQVVRGQQGQQPRFAQQRQPSPSLPSSSPSPVPSTTPHTPRFPPQLTAPPRPALLPPAITHNPPAVAEAKSSVQSGDLEVICLDSDDSDDSADNADDGDDGDDEEEEEEEEEGTPGRSGLAGARHSHGAASPLLNSVPSRSIQPSSPFSSNMSTPATGNPGMSASGASGVDPQMAATLARILAAARNSTGPSVGHQVLASASHQLLADGGSNGGSSVTKINHELQQRPVSLLSGLATHKAISKALPHSTSLPLLSHPFQRSISTSSLSSTAPVYTSSQQPISAVSGRPSATLLKHSRNLMQKLNMAASSQTSPPLITAPSSQPQSAQQPIRQPQALLSSPRPAPPPLHRLVSATQAQALHRTLLVSPSNQLLSHSAPLLPKPGDQQHILTVPARVPPIRPAVIAVSVPAGQSLPLQPPSGVQATSHALHSPVVVRPPPQAGLPIPPSPTNSTHSHLGRTRSVTSPSPSSCSSISDDPSDYPLLSPVAAELYRRSQQQSAEEEKSKRSSSPALLSPSSSSSNPSPHSVRSPLLSLPSWSPGVPRSPSLSAARSPSPYLLPAKKTAAHLSTSGSQMGILARSETHDFSPSPRSV